MFGRARLRSTTSFSERRMAIDWRQHALCSCRSIRPESWRHSLRKCARSWSRVRTVSSTRLRAFCTMASVAVIGTGCTHGSPSSPEVARQLSRAVLAEADVALVARLLEVADTRRLDTTLVDQALSSRTPYVRALGV